LLKLFGAKVGRDFIMRGEIINPELFEAGENVEIGAGSFLITHLRDGSRLTYKKIRMCNNSAIGVKSIIFPGVEMGENSSVAACSLVPKDTKIPPEEMWAGIPARKIKNNISQIVK